MLYPINTIIAIDQATGARVENGSGYVYAVSDTARVTPLSIFDLSGLPLTSNLLTTNSEALIPPFQVEGEWQVVFVSGDSEIILTSYLGLKEEAAASADAANTVVTRADNGEFKGEQGDSAYQVWLSLGNTGTVEDYRADIEGPPGKDGSNVLPTDEAIEQAVTTDGTATNAALKATFVPKWEPNTAYALGAAVLNPTGDVVTATAAHTSGAAYDPAQWNLSQSFALKGETAHPSFQSLNTALQQLETSVGVLVIGDSTGTDTTEWVYKLGEALAAENPDWSVYHYPWDDVAQSMRALQGVIQYGPGGERRIVFGDTGAYIADGGAPDITGDIDLRFRASATTWNPAGNEVLASKNASGDQRGWMLMVQPGGNLSLTWYEDGTSTSVKEADSTVPVPYVDGEVGFVRATLDVDNGAGGWTANFYTSTNGVDWTALGAAVTGTGVTQIGPVSAPWELGSYANTGFVWSGTIYNAEVRRGIDGPPVNPLNIDAWAPYAGTTVAAGAPVIYIFNASQSGADIDYLTEPTRMQHMVNDAETIFAIISCSHNDKAQRGPAYLAKWRTLADYIRERCPMAEVFVSSQNPRIDPAFFIEEHAIRRQQLQAWAAREGHSYLDIFQTFLDSEQPLTDLIATDGVHPVEAGSIVWRDHILDAIHRAA